LMRIVSLMTLRESQTASNRNKSFVFGASDFEAAPRAQEWDRMKIVCSQPFTSEPIGLSYVLVNDEGSEKVTTEKSEASATTKEPPKAKEEDSSGTEEMGDDELKQALVVMEEGTEEEGARTAKDHQGKPEKTQQKDAEETESADEEALEYLRRAADQGVFEPMEQDPEDEGARQGNEDTQEMEVEGEEKDREEPERHGSQEKQGTKEDERKGKEYALSPLPSFLEGVVVYLYGTFSEAPRKKLTRSITAYKGEVADYWTDDVTHVVVSPQQDWDDECEKVVRNSPTLKIVKPSWVFDCCKQQQIASAKEHFLKRRK